MTFRKLIFWLHLVAGLTAGLAIGVMCFTGTALAFEKEITAWAERDVRRVTPPSDGATRLSIDDLLQRARATQPHARPAAIVVSSDMNAAIAFTTGRDGGFYANPYTGEIRQGSAEKTRAFLQKMNSWHRTLALTGDNRNVGKYINGASNLAFCVLAISGLYLWWPRSWSARTVKPIVFFNLKFEGKARDFNWHNVIGLWSAPLLIVLTITAFPISYQWGGTFINYVTGTAAPAARAQGGGPGGPGGPAVEVPKLAEGAKPLGYDALIASVQKESPRWNLITLRLTNAAPNGQSGGRSAPAPMSANGADEPRPLSTQKREGHAESTSRPAEAGEARRGGRGEGGGERRARAGNRDASTTGNSMASTSAPNLLAQAVTFTVRQSGSWPRTATTTLTLDPYSGSVLKREGFSDQTLGRQVRSWTRSCTPVKPSAPSDKSRLGSPLWVDVFSSTPASRWRGVDSLANVLPLHRRPGPAGRSVPNTPAELASSWLQRGQHHEARHTPEGLNEALRCYHEAIGLLHAWPQRDQSGQRDLAIAWMNLGNANQKIGNAAALKDAIKAYEEALGLFQTLPLATDPGDRNSAGAAWMNLGLSLHRLATPEAIAEAEQSHRQAVALLSTLPLNENPWYRNNLAAAWLNLANALLDARPTGRFAEARAAALAGLEVAQPFEKNELAAADLSLKCRRAWCDSLGQLLVAPAYAPTRGQIASEASDAVDDALTLIRHWRAQDPRLTSELAIRFYRFGAQLYRFHQPHFLAEFLLENIPTAAAERLEEFREVARNALSAAMADLQPRQFISLENPAHARLLETWRELQAARSEIDQFVLPVLALENGPT